VTLVHHLAASERTGARAFARLAVERALLSSSDLVIATSETTRREVLHAGVAENRTRVAPPGRDRLGTRTTTPAPAADGSVRLLFVGALTPRKGVLDLLSAFSMADERSTLTIVGPADRNHRYAAAVLRAASPWGRRVRVTGALDDERLERAFDEHDVLVLPSRYEGFGIVVAEAASHGLAIVATDAGAISEVVRHQDDALLVGAGDRRALGDALSRITRDRALCSSMQARALRRAAALPTWRDTEEAFAQSLGL
jgi:glycosyltransferase involved in cell wall biosynthesis